MMKTPLAHSPRKGTGAQTYLKHITQVNSRANTNAKAASQFYKGDRAKFLEVVHSAALYHDLGKLDEKNQEVLSRISKEKLPIPHEDAGVAALLGLWRTEAAALVMAHHAGLFDAEQESEKKSHIFRDVRHIACINNTVADHVNSLLDQYCSLHLDAGLPTLSIQDKQPLHKCGFTRRIALSCLVDADHGDTAQNYGREIPVTKLETRWAERLAALNHYVEELEETSSRDPLRRQVYQTCRDAAISEPMRCCDAPVGSGKTTAVMAHLLQVAQKLGLRHIIVVLPYTNIIKQSVEVYRKALVLPGERPEDVVAEHHHRADFSTVDLRQLATLWQAPVIVTTAVQFFETLASHHPAGLRKLHELPGSAVFVDEVHAALPSHLWGQAWKWLETWMREWSGYLVLASGSLPRFWETEEMAELIGKDQHVSDLLHDDLRKELNEAEQKRIQYRSVEDILNIDGLIKLALKHKGPRVIILNTVQSAAVVADVLQRRGHQVMHLSTALAPNDRDRIVDRILARLKGSFNDWTLIATSCVEAGMNFSFCSGFRERAATASLIQVGGRVSRGAEFDDAVVWDFLLEDDLITQNPDLALSRRVLGSLFESGDVNMLTPGELAKLAMQQELTEGDFERARELMEMERLMRYPLVSKLARVIASDTRTIVVSRDLAEAICDGKKIDRRDLLRGSVQMWTSKISKKTLPIELLSGHPDDSDALYFWKSEYDPDFLGYMAGALPILRTTKEQVFIA